MKKKLFVQLWTLALLVTFQANAQQNLSSNAIGLGGATSTLNGDDASALLNPAGIKNDSSICVGTIYHRSYLLQELDRKVAFAVAPIQNSNTVSVSYEQQGFELYKRSRLSFSYGRKFGKQIAAGVRFNHHVLRLAEDYGKFRRNEVVAGMQAILTSQFILGVQCTQPIAAIKEDPFSWNGKAEIRIGVGYKFSEVFSIYTDGAQLQGSEILLCSGMKYRAVKLISLRAGIDWKQFNGGFGCTFLIQKFSLGIDAMYHRQLGFSPVASIIFTPFKSN
jgi:hypothetical protein